MTSKRHKVIIFVTPGRQEFGTDDVNNVSRTMDREWSPKISSKVSSRVPESANRYPSFLHPIAQSAKASGPASLAAAVLL